MMSIPQQEHVILLHGMTASSARMQALAVYLQKQDYVVHNLDYPSTRHPLTELIEIIKARVVDLRLTQVSKINWVGHSLGAILAQRFIQAYPLANLGRVVALAPPYAGSEMADLITKIPLLRWRFGPALKELTTKAFPGHLLQDSLNYDLGVLAGEQIRLRDWLLARCLFRETNDGKVRVASTKLMGMRDHHVLPVNHFDFPRYVCVMEQTAYFLRHGVFYRFRNK